jgi:predicted nucleic acid-binding protein
MLLDTDVLLDFAIGRSPHLEASTGILEWASLHPGQCAVAWHSISNIHYLTKGNSQSFLSDLLEFVVIPSTGTQEMKHALDLEFSDLEDAMQTAAATTFKAQIIVTRNTKDFRKSPIKAVHPKDALLMLRKR